MGARPPSGWHPGMGMNQQGPGQMFLPPPQPRAIGGMPGSAPHDAAHATHRPAPTRAHTLPVPVNMGQGAPFAQLPPLSGMDQLRDASGRFVARGTVAAMQTTGGQVQDFIQGSSRGGRRTSSSSGSD